jgi:phosphoglycerate dehydrogenase-like enzyme
MKPSAFLINVARGPIVDTTALLDALGNRRIAGAALDVFETEPLPPDSPLWRAPNLLVSPHMAGDSDGWDSRVVELFGENVRRYLRGEPLRNVVDPARGY